MKKYLSIIILSFFSLTAFPQSDNIIGIWLTQDKEAKVKIYKLNNTYYGKIIWLKNLSTQKQINLGLITKIKTVLKDNELLGSTMLWGFKYSNGEYVNGNVYDSRDGETYSGKLWLEYNNNLKMRGYWGFLYSTEIWKRVKQ